MWTNYSRFIREQVCSKPSQPCLSSQYSSPRFLSLSLALSVALLPVLLLPLRAPLSPRPHSQSRTACTPGTQDASQHRTMGFRSEKTDKAMKKTKSNRKSSWVMLAENGGYTPLPGEQTLYQSPPRTALSLQTSNRHPPSASYSQQCKSGVVFLTNRRVRYIRHHKVYAAPTRADLLDRSSTCPCPQHHSYSPSPSPFSM